MVAARAAGWKREEGTRLWRGLRRRL